MPWLPISQIETMDDMIDFRDELQTLLYAEIENLKQYRKLDIQQKSKSERES